MPIEDHHDSLELYSYGMRRACSTNIDRYHPAIVVKCPEGEASRPTDPIKLAHWIADREHQQELYRAHIGTHGEVPKRYLREEDEVDSHTSELTGLERRLKRLGVPPEGPERQAYLKEGISGQLAREPNNPVIQRLAQGMGIEPQALKPAAAVPLKPKQGSEAIKPSQEQNNNTSDERESRELPIPFIPGGNSIDTMITAELERGRKFRSGSPKTRLHQQRLRELLRIKAEMSAKAQPVAQPQPQPVSKSQLPTRIEMDPERTESSVIRLPNGPPPRTTLDDTYGAQDDGETRRLRRLAIPAITPAEKLQRAADLGLQAKLAAKALKPQAQKADSEEVSNVSKPCAQPKPAETTPLAAKSTTPHENPVTQKRPGINLAGIFILGGIVLFPLVMLALQPLLLAPVLLLFVWWVCACLGAAAEKDRLRRRALREPPQPEPPIVPVKRGQLTTASQRARFLANQMSYDELVAAWKNCKSPSMKAYYQRQIDYLNEKKEEL